MSFWGKVKAAFAIFFPPSEEETARLEAKKRLRMILVADRCAMSGAAMSAMKARVVEVVGEFLDVDDDAEVDIATTQDPTGESITTMYAVSIPVRGVKPQFDVENETYGWDEEPTDAPYDDDVGGGGEGGGGGVGDEMMSLAAFRKRFVNYVKYLFLHHDHLTARRR